MLYQALERAVWDVLVLCRGAGGCADTLSTRVLRTSMGHILLHSSAGSANYCALHEPQRATVPLSTSEYSAKGCTPGHFAPYSRCNEDRRQPLVLDAQVAEARVSKEGVHSYLEDRPKGVEEVLTLNYSETFWRALLLCYQGWEPLLGTCGVPC